jgi:MinD-like ATPase involved in chromosome partitioning or flagellar assembly
MAQDRPPLRVLVGGAEGGVGTSTVTALLGELIAASSPGPTVVADQCGAAWNALVRRLVGEQAGMPAAQVGDMFELGASASQIASVAPKTSAGAALIEDGRGYRPLHDITKLAHTTCGALVVDAGRADGLFAARLDIRPVAVVVGRADVVGAEAVCAAVNLLRESAIPVEPVVVLSSAATTSSGTERRRVQAATTLVTAAGITHLVHLPHDARLASGQPLRLDQVGKSTAIAGMRLLSRIGTIQGENHRAHRHRPSAGSAAGPPPD